MPGRVGMVSGLFFGFAFGMGGIGAAVLGVASRLDEYRHGVSGLCVFCRCSGLLTAFLPKVEAG